MNSIITLSILFFVFLTVATQFPLDRKCKNTEYQCDNGACISKTNWCTNHYYCKGSSSSKGNCGKYYPNCAFSQTHCLKDKKCIPKRWICDGLKDCSDGSDEETCLNIGYRLLDIDGVGNATEKAISWLLKQRRVNWGWGKDTHRAITALYFTNMTQFSFSNPQNDVMIKQLQLQLSELLLKYNRSIIPDYEIALYVHSLLATCLDPKKFQNINLVKELMDRMSNSDDVNPFLALATCNSNENLTSSQILYLFKILTEPHTPLWTDSQAITMMTFLCFRRRNKSEIDNYSSSLNETISDSLLANDDVNSMIKRFVLLQEKDGSFGNLHTTALIMQMLMASNNYGDNWNIIKAFQYVISKQKEDGSFGDILTTYFILPILHGRSLVDLANVSCNSSTIDMRNMTVQEEMDSRKGNRHRVIYQIWVGLQRDIAFSVSLNVPEETVFYDVMRLAAELDERYRFKYIQYNWGKYIYSMFNIINDPEARKYWELYHIKPDKAFVINQSVDRVIPKNNDIYVFWYKPLNKTLKT